MSTARLKKRVLKNPVSTHASFFVLPNSWLEWFTSSTITLIDLLVQEYVHAQQMTFRDDIIETDTAQFGAKKDGKKRTFAGRMQVMESRLNKGWSVVALNDKNTHGKRGAGGAESTSEVLPALRRSLQRETIVAADGSAAFKSLLPKWKKSTWKGCHTWQKFLLPPWNFGKDLCLVLKPKPCRSTQSVDTVLWKKPNVVSL